MTMTYPRASNSTDRVNIRSSDRVFFAGMTGSGKTTLANRLLLSFPRFTILDPKRRYTAGELPGVPIVQEYNPQLARQIVKPPYQRREFDMWGDIIEMICITGNQVMYVDELNLITRPRPILWELGKAIRTGREYGLGVWSGSQRPKEVPSEVFTEAEHIFIFRLNFIMDRLKIRAFTGDAMFAAQRALRGHSFIYYNQRTGKAYHLPPIASGQ